MALNAPKVPFETPNVSKGTFMTLPGRGAKVPFAALSAVKATFAAHGAWAAAPTHTRPGPRASITAQRLGWRHGSGEDQRG
ncbi:hypothetical protein [Kutzneria viridogrisea]